MKHYPEKIVVNGVTYVHGPATPGILDEDKCAKCAAANSDALCEAMGGECLRADPVYWIVAPAAPAEPEGKGRMIVCEKCGRKHRAALSIRVRVSATSEQMWCSDCFSSHGDFCQRCGTKMSSEYKSEVDGDSWCHTCRDAHASKCDQCNTWTLKTAMSDVIVEARAVQHWCRVCRDSHAVPCNHCHKHVKSGIAETVDGTKWCRACADEFSAPCEGCGNLSANLEFNESSDQYLCVNCNHRTARAGAALVYDYHGFARSRSLTFWGGAKEDPAVLFMGFELEAGGATDADCRKAAEELHALDTDEKRFHMEHDGSIPSCGFETISSPHTLAEHAKYDWAKVCKTLVSKGFKSHDTGGRCGLHVHVSRAFLTPDDCAKLDIVMLKNKLFWERVARRSEVTYAAFIQKDKMSDYGKSGNRYAAVNFQNPKTVEFRLFRGTLKHDTLMATLQIVDGICRWVKTRTVAQLHTNDGELDKFVEFLEQDKEMYGKALEYIAKRKAVANPNDRTAGDENPDV